MNYSNYIFHEIIALWYAKTKVNKLTKLQNSYSIKILGDQGLEHSSIILSSSIGPFEGKHTKNWNKYSHPWWTQSHNRFQTKTHYTWLKHPHNNTQHENLNMKYFSPLVWTLLSPHTRQIPFSYNLLGVLQRWNNILYSR